MLFRSLLFISHIGLLNGCTIFHENRLQSQAELKNVGTEVIPFTYVKKLIVVEATVNAKANRKFIFDTGAFQSKVENGLAESLSLEKEYSRNNGTAQGISKRINITNLDSIQLSSSMYYNIAAGVIKYPPDSYSQCVAESGIIGSNLIKLSNWKIDYQNKQLTSSEKPLQPLNKQKTSQLKFKTSYLSGVPLVDLMIEGQVIENVIFDLGYNGGIVIPKKHASNFPYAESEKVVDQSTSGIFGTSRNHLDIKYLNLKLGESTTKVPIEFSSIDKALIGNDFLEHFTIYIDYENEVITLEEISNIEIDKSRPFLPGILNDSLWIVDRVNADIPLSIGDTLKSINGFQPKDVFESNCDYFLNISTLFETDTLVVRSLDKKTTVIKTK